MTCPSATTGILGLWGFFGSLLAAMAVAAPPPDPLQSVQWETMYKAYLDGRPVVFDDRITVIAPGAAEDSLAVPVLVDASGLGQVERILVFADLNPLPKVLEFEPRGARPVVGFSMKVQQSTPIRAAVLTADDDSWHVAGVWVEAAGGGCTLPSVASGDSDWSSRLGEVSGRLWPRGGGQRLKFGVMHPMDTGLAPGIPAFYLETIVVSDTGGRTVALLRPFEPISENPVFSLDLSAQGAVTVQGRDNNGSRFRAEVVPPGPHAAER